MACGNAGPIPTVDEMEAEGIAAGDMPADLSQEDPPAQGETLLLLQLMHTSWTCVTQQVETGCF